MEEEHPMDEPAPKVTRETLETKEEAEEAPSAAVPSSDTPMDEMLSDNKSLRSTTSSMKESPATEEKVEDETPVEEEKPAEEEKTEEEEKPAEEEKPEEQPEETPEEKPVETPEVEEEKKEEEDAPVAPTTEGKDDEPVDEAAEEKKEEEDKESAKEEAAEVEDVSDEAKRETSKLKTILGGMKKSIKKKVSKIKSKRSSKNKGSNTKEQKPEEQSKEKSEPNPADDELDVPKLVDDRANPAEEQKQDTDDEASENEEIIKNLRGAVLSLEDENKELQRRLLRMKAQATSGDTQLPFDERVSDTLATKEFENMTPDEKIKQLDSQVQKWQKLYLESNEIGPSRIEKLEEGYDEASSMARSTSGATNDGKDSNNGNDDRILVLEYQLRESVKVLKTAQKKMVAQHEKEFHLQKTVDDLSEQINELNMQVKKANENEANMKMQMEQEQKSKLEAEAQLAQERQRLDDFREDLGLEPLYKDQATVVDDQVDQQIQQSNNSSIFCWGSSVQPISQ